MLNVAKSGIVRRDFEVPWSLATTDTIHNRLQCLAAQADVAFRHSNSPIAVSSHPPRKGNSDKYFYFLLGNQHLCKLLVCVYVETTHSQV